jgi:hypothetical protein
MNTFIGFNFGNLAVIVLWVPGSAPGMFHKTLDPWLCVAAFRTGLLVSV